MKLLALIVLLPFTAAPAFADGDVDPSDPVRSMSGVAANWRASGAQMAAARGAAGAPAAAVAGTPTSAAPSSPETAEAILLTWRRECPAIAVLQALPPSTKRGVGMPTGVSNGSSIVGRLRPFWYYDWEAGPLTGAASEFVPMIRDNEAGNVERNFYELSRGKPGFVLAYDEPDLSSIPPEDKFWTKSYAPRLSPSIVPASPASSNDDWYKSFLKSPTAADFKIMAVHLFVDVKDISAKDVDTEVAEFKERLESVVKESQRPVWVTEFGLKTPNATPGSPAKFSDKKAACFMAQVIPLLEKKAMRYAWFSPVPDARNPQDATLPDALWNRDGSLTTLGTLYRQ